MSVADELRDWHGRWTVGNSGHHAPGHGGEAEAAKRFHNDMTVDEHGNITVTIPIEVTKKYSLIKPYEPDPAETPEAQRSGLDYMAKFEHTVRAEGLGGFKGLPAIEVGESGKHAVLSDGNHRIWAADAVGLKHVRVQIITGEPDDWAKQYGFPVDPHIRDILRQASGPGKGGRVEAARRFGTTR